MRSYNFFTSFLFCMIRYFAWSLANSRHSMILQIIYWILLLPILLCWSLLLFWFPLHFLCTLGNLMIPYLYLCLHWLFTHVNKILQITNRIQTSIWCNTYSKTNVSHNNINQERDMQLFNNSQSVTRTLMFLSH